MSGVRIAGNIQLLIFRAHAFHVDALGIFQPDPFGTLHAAVAGVRTGQRNAVGQRDALAVGTLDHGCDDVPDIEVAGRAAGFCRQIKPSALGGGGGQAQEAVATIDAQDLGDGAQTVGRIEVGITEFIVQCPFGAGAVPCHFGKVVLVTAFTVDQFPEHAFADHVQHHKFFTAVAAVFQHHAGNAGGFCGMDQMPEFVNAGSTAHFDPGVLARVHGGFGDLEMGVPGGGNEDRIHIGILDQLTVVRICCRFGAVVGGDDVQDLFDPRLIKVTDRRDDHFALESKHGGKERFCSCAEPDNTDFHCIVHRI